MAWNQGDTFGVAEKDPSLDSHTWIVLSDPNKDQSQIVVVNFTKWKDGKDPTCIIKAGSHNRVKVDSCIPYNYAMIMCLADLVNLFGSGKIILYGPLGDPVLKAILHGASITDDMPTACRNVLVQQGFIHPRPGPSNQ